MISRTELKVSALLFLYASLATFSFCGYSESLPPSTAVPVIFTHSIEAGKVSPGTPVTAKTSEVVFLPGGRVLPAGSTLRGHVVQSSSFVFDRAPYATQKPSTLSIHFDAIEVGKSTAPVSLSVRALAGPVVARQAAIPHYLDETDTTGTRILVGGSSFSPVQGIVESRNGKIVGYDRKQGVFARLTAAYSLDAGAAYHCGATNSEQSVGIFSPDACGVYGLNAVEMPDNGSQAHGAFVLESDRRTVTIFAGTTALLQVLGQ